MSVKVSRAKELSAAASPAAEIKRREPDEVEYPERHWTAQSLWHGVAVRQAAAAMDYHFRNRDDVLVGMELVVYYERGNNRAWLRPDLQVVFGVSAPKRNRSTYKVWEEGKGPDFVLEVASPSTAERDARHKAWEYARIGVREYWRLDPEGTILGTSLEGYSAREGRYYPVESVGHTTGAGYLRSKVLGLDLRGERRDEATVLVIRDPRTGKEFDGTVESAVESAVESSERERKLAEDRARAAEARVRELEQRS